jgi:exodeoxyribonuclease V gamma subunit
VSETVDLHIYRSNRTEALVTQLSDIVAQPIGGPFDSETIIVQGRGMAVWLSQQLAIAHGVWAGAEYPFPRRYIERCLRAVLTDQALDVGLVDEERLRWAVLQQLPLLCARPDFSRLRSYIEGKERGIRLFQLADRIARRFDEYLTYRPEMMRDWDAGKSDLPDAHAWQPILWRAVAARLSETGGCNHMASLERDFMVALARGVVPRGLPKRISLMGLSTLPPLYLRIITALATQVQTHIFLFSPGQGDWWNQSRPDAITRALETDADLNALHLDAGHPLLQSMGGLGAEFQRSLDETLEAMGARYQEHDLYQAPVTGSVLTNLQGTIYASTEGEARRRRPRIQSTDRSVSIHSCHSPMREVEVLHDQLLNLLTGKDPLCKPHEIVVLLPDVETYAPFVEAVFERDPTDPRFVPYRIADRPIQVDSPVIESLSRILDIVDSRLSAPQVLDLLTLEPIARRFALDATSLDKISEWVTRSNIRWGKDGQHRASHGQPGIEINTWAFGLDRLLLGYALPTNEMATFADVLPFDDLEGNDAVLLGRLAEFLSTLFAQLDRLAGPRSLEDWRDALTETLDALLLRDQRTEWQHQRLCETLSEIVESAKTAEFDEPVDLRVIRLLLEGRVDAAFPERGFLSGGVTFCAMVPMRSIPFRVVCLLGMNDGAFPRSGKTVDFDLIKRGPEPARPGDRDRRKDDRYLFLETISAARDQLLITYTGQSIRDNNLRPPSVVVSELIDTIADTHLPPKQDQAQNHDDLDRRRAIANHLVIRHPLQSFSRRYFDNTDQNLFSFAEDNARGAQALSPARVPAPPFIEAELPTPAADGASAVEHRIALQDLARFLRDPAQHLCNRRLNISFREESIDVPAREPIELDGLDSWRLGDLRLKHAQAGISDAQSLELFRANGLLPIGTMGRIVFDEVVAVADKISEKVREFRIGAQQPPLAVDQVLEPGLRLEGIISDLWPSGIVTFQYSRISKKQLLELWVRHLALCCELSGRAPPTTTLIGRPGKKTAKFRGREAKKDADGVAVISFHPVADARKHLSALARLFELGQRAPLAFAPESSGDFVTKLREKGSVELALAEAIKTYNGGYNSGEREQNLYLQRIFGEESPPFTQTFTVGPDFPTLARGIYEPLMNAMVSAEEKGKR